MKNAFIFLTLLLISNYSISQDQEVDFEFTIDSEHFKKERKIYVHLPKDYYQMDEQEFGVIYVLDGQGTSFYNNAKSIIDYLVWGSQIFPVMVVGIHSDDRGPEFVPKNRTLADDDPDNFGTAHLLQGHLAEEVFPLIQEKFRTSQFRALIGHSRGGAFVANTLFSDKKDMFNAYVAISPGMHYIDKQILNDVETSIKSGAPFHKFFYATYGTIGSLEKYFKPQVEYIDSLLTEHPNPTLVWEKKEFENTTHWGVVAPSISYALLSMSRAYQADQYLIDKFCDTKTKSVAEQIDHYYQQQEKNLGFTYPISARDIKYYGDQQSEYENYDRASELYELAISKGGADHRLFSSAGWNYQKWGKKQKAKEYYERCIKLYEENDMAWDKEKQNRSIAYHKNLIDKLLLNEDDK